MPHIRPFRALRYDIGAIGDPALVTAPPYDVVDAEQRARLVARHPANVIRLDLPADEPGDGPDDRYRRVARTLAEWRSGGVLRKDPHPSVYVYEQAYVIPGTSHERTQRGFFARLRLEAFGPDADVLPHERTLSGPREDRYKLLRATGVNTSPVVVLFDDANASGARAMDEATTRPPDVEVTDDDGVVHRLWAVPADGEGPSAELSQALIGAAGTGPVTIADGHHRYETALRFRDERRMTRSCEEDPAFDYLLALFLDAAQQPLTVLPTHRLLRSVGAEGVGTVLRQRAPELFEVEPVDAVTLRSTFGEGGLEPGGAGRFGLWTSTGGAVLRVRRDAIEPFLPAGGAALRGLDVTVLGVALERLAGIDAAAVTAGAIGYTKSAAEALAAVDAGEAEAAILLDGTPVATIQAVARDGDVMPQKSTYFYPKALTGLLINPHEW